MHSDSGCEDILQLEKWLAAMELARTNGAAQKTSLSRIVQASGAGALPCHTLLAEVYEMLP